MNDLLIMADEWPWLGWPLAGVSIIVHESWAAQVSLHEILGGIVGDSNEGAG